MIKDVATFVSNGFVGKVSPHFTEPGNGVLYIQGYNVRENKIDLDGVTYVTRGFAAEQTKSRLEAGDMLTVQSGHIGTSAVVPAELAGANCHAVIITRFEKEKIDPRFIAYYLNSSLGRRLLRGLIVGSSVLHINTKDLKILKIPCPPIEEQRKIAEILGAWDKAFELTERLIEALKKRKKGLMQRLLTGEVRFLEFGDVPWKKASLSELGLVTAGGTPNTKDNSLWNGDILWITPSEITKLESRHIEDTERKITRKGLERSSATLISPNSVLVCTRATVGQCAINSKPIATNQGFKSITPSQEFDVDYIYYHLQFHKKDLIRYSSGSTFLELSKKDFSKLEYDFPALAEQKRIASILAEHDDQIGLLEKNSRLLNMQKKGLMQRLLTGQVRVKVD